MLVRKPRCTVITDMRGLVERSMMNIPQGATIARVWRGRTTAADAPAYTEYWLEHGIKVLAENALGVHAYREQGDGEVEFIAISFWKDVDTMSSFAGSDPRRIRHLTRDPEFLVELPDAVQILDIVAEYGAGRSPEVSGDGSS
jgi:hypothetical protein